MQLNPYLMFNGECEAAFKFYEQCLGGKIDAMMKHQDSPMADKAAPAGWGDRVLHARLQVAGTALMGSDAPPDRYEKPKGTFIALHIDELQRAERIFNELSQNGTVVMPFQQTFWAFRFGMLIDRFGTPWMVNCEKAA
jgi:PhnB protein